MEKAGLIESLEFLDKKKKRVDGLITDRHPSIQKYMREHRPETEHSFDLWHIVKGKTIFCES